MHNDDDGSAYIAEFHNLPELCNNLRCVPQNAMEIDKHRVRIAALPTFARNHNGQLLCCWPWFAAHTAKLYVVISLQRLCGRRTNTKQSIHYLKYRFTSITASAAL